MTRTCLLALAAAGAITAVAVIPTPVPAKPGGAARQDVNDRKFKRRVEDAVEKGLEWLKKNQAGDGHWAAQNGQYPTAMTALAGMALLMEGSTLKEGKYSDEIRKAIDWLTAPNRLAKDANGNYTGLIGDTRNPTEARRYMYGHGFSTMFLASAYGEEEDKEQREKIEGVLKRAVQFIAEAQTTKKHRLPEGKTIEVGGWGYVSSKDGSNFDEGSVTITQLQALRAARNAGIAVPKEVIQKATDYLEACTTPNGGVIYSYSNGGGQARNGQERVPITAAAIACSFSAGQYKGDLAKKWLKFCQSKISVGTGTRYGHAEYQNYYYSQVVYVLGDDRYGKLFDPEGNNKESWLTWTKYKEALFTSLLDQQDANTGAWSSGYIGPVYTTSINLTILQLDKGILPIYQR